MTTFALFCEGPTDHAVLENLLTGFFQGAEEPDCNPLFPPPNPSAPDRKEGGWGPLLQALKSGQVQKALQLNDYALIAIDTDVCEDYGVSRQVEGRVRTPEELARAVQEELVQRIGEAFYEAHKQRILFAIGVDELECWLLPLLFEQPAKRKKVTGCFEALDNALKLQDRPRLSNQQKGKDVPGYRALSKPLCKRRALEDCAQHHASFVDLLQQLNARGLPPKT